MGYALVVIGAPGDCTGSLGEVLDALSPQLPFPVVLVGHREADGGTFPAAVRARCGMPAEEANDKALLRPGRLSIAPPDYHLLVDRDGLALCRSAPVAGRRPSITALVRSALEVTGGRVFVFLLGGTGADGAEAARAAAAFPGVVLVCEGSIPFSPLGPTASVIAAHIRELSAWNLH